MPCRVHGPAISFSNDAAGTQKPPGCSPAPAAVSHKGMDGSERPGYNRIAGWEPWAVLWGHKPKAAVAHVFPSVQKNGLFIRFKPFFFLCRTKCGRKIRRLYPNRGKSAGPEPGCRLCRPCAGLPAEPAGGGPAENAGSGLPLAPCRTVWNSFNRKSTAWRHKRAMMPSVGIRDRERRPLTVLKALPPSGSEV